MPKERNGSLNSSRTFPQSSKTIRLIVNWYPSLTDFHLWMNWYPSMNWMNWYLPYFNAQQLQNKRKKIQYFLYTTQLIKRIPKLCSNLGIVVWQFGGSLAILAQSSVEPISSHLSETQEERFRNLKDRRDNGKRKLNNTNFITASAKHTHALKSRAVHHWKWLVSSWHSATHDLDTEKTFHNLKST